MNLDQRIEDSVRRALDAFDALMEDSQSMSAEALQLAQSIENLALARSYEYEVVDASPTD
jgi:hypothetical protein